MAIVTTTMDATTILPFPTADTREALRRARDQVLDLSIAQGDARSDLEALIDDWTTDSETVERAIDRLDDLTRQLTAARDELARLVSRTGAPAA